VRSFGVPEISSLNCLKLFRKYQSLNTYKASTWVPEEKDPFASPAVTSQLKAEVKCLNGVWRVLVDGKELIDIPSAKEFAEDYVKCAKFGPLFGFPFD